MQIKLSKIHKILALAAIALLTFIAYDQLLSNKQTKLEQQMKQDAVSKIKPKEVKKVVHEQLPKKVEKRKATEDEIEFIVSRDYNAVLACQKMLSNSLNKDLQAQWMQERLAVNAQRERTKAAELSLKEQEATFQAMQLEQQKKALNSQNNLAGWKVDAAKNQNWPAISLISISDKKLATFKLGGSTFIDKGEGDFINEYLISKVEKDERCLSFVSSNSGSKRVCI